MIAIIDYGMANLRSVEKALVHVGGDPVITSDPGVIARADRVVLPGVGAFCACMNNLNSRGLNNSVIHAINSGKPFLGICVGMQMLFDTSSEMGINPGLGILPGRVVKFFDDEESAPDVMGGNAASTDARREGPFRDLKVPHMGWNLLDASRDSYLLSDIDAGSRVYFVHSYYPIPTDTTIVSASCCYGVEFCCAIETRNIAAMQFHPEKSGAVGLRILRNFVSWNPVI